MSGLIFCIQNAKGGVGKSTVSANLAHTLACQGKRVLTIDTDPQSNLTSLFFPENFQIERSFYDVLSDTIDIKKCIIPTEYERLSCMPNIDLTSSIEPAMMTSLPNSFFLMRRRLREQVKEMFDFIIIDTPPNLGFFSMSALMTADFVIVPIAAGSRFAMEGLEKALATIQELRKKDNKDLKFLRLLVNKMDRRTAISKINLEKIKSTFTAEQVFETTIPQTTAFERAEDVKRTIIRYDPSSAGAKAYRSLAQEILDILS